MLVLLIEYLFYKRPFAIYRLTCLSIEILLEFCRSLAGTKQLN